MEWATKNIYKKKTEIVFNFGSQFVFTNENRHKNNKNYFGFCVIVIEYENCNRIPKNKKTASKKIKQIKTSRG